MLKKFMRNWIWRAIASFMLVGLVSLAQAEDRYGDLSPFYFQKRAISTCVDNIKYRMDHGTIPPMTKAAARERCIQEYIQQAQEDVDLSERLTEELSKRRYPEAMSPKPPCSVPGERINSLLLAYLRATGACSDRPALPSPEAPSPPRPAASPSPPPPPPPVADRAMKRTFIQEDDGSWVEHGAAVEPGRRYTTGEIEAMEAAQGPAASACEMREKTARLNLESMERKWVGELFRQSEQWKQLAPTPEKTRRYTTLEIQAMQRGVKEMEVVGIPTMEAEMATWEDAAAAKGMKELKKVVAVAKAVVEAAKAANAAAERRTAETTQGGGK